jgi:cysteine-rich repeat protein
MMKLAKGGDRPYIDLCILVAMPVIAMLWLLLASADPASAAPTARFTASPVQGATCVAPCVVHLDATATTSTEHPRPFHELDYEWDCDEPNAGTWRNRTGGDKNRPRGALTGCVYATPGTRTIRLTVREPDGETSTTQTNVTVADPNVHFSGTNTVCVSASGNFTDCPAGAARVTSSDYDAALMDNDKCNVDGGKRRCLLRCGETFTQSALVSFAGGTSPGLLSCFGGTTGRANVNSTVSMGTVNQGWTVSALNWRNSTTGGSAVGLHHNFGNITLYDNALTTQSGGSASMATTGTTHPNLVAIVGSTHTVNPVTGLAGYSQHFLRASRQLILGNVFDANGEGEFSIRSIHTSLSAIQHNELLDPQDDIAGGIARNPLQLRAMASPLTGVPVIETRYVVVSDNWTESTIGTGANSGLIFRVCQENGCNASPGYGVDMVDVIFERNMSRATGNTAIGVNGFFYLQGGRITVRNNVIDLQGAVTSGTAEHTLVYQYPNQSQCPSCVDDEIVVQSNTVYWDEPSTRGITFCKSSVGTGHVCQLNLAYRPNDTTVRPEVTGNWTTGGNVSATANPFTAVPPDRGQTVAADFALSSASVARNRLGVLASRTGLLKDFGHRCRIPSTTGAYDAGAWEQGATDCTGTPPPPAVCGNGTREGAELCDDGNSTSGDGCSSVCLVEAPACGNGRLESGESCDDGNLAAGDGCRANCSIERCGDRIVDARETCDDGNATAGDGCSATCLVEAPACGNGRLESGESCDDGNTAAGDGCSATCLAEAPACGNGRLESGESCDDGNLAAGDGCRANCSIERCGDRIVDARETCDDGNTAAGDGCSATCLVEAPACGNGRLESGESCDDGNLAAGDGCRANCSVERCGDAVVDPRENCDDGNAVAGDGCSSLCLTEVSGCGDGTLDTGEACDDGNAVGGDGCRANCSVEVCGDGLLDGAEACDDGNRVAGDACSPTCTVEVEPGSDEHWINVGGPDFNDFQGHTWFTDAPFVNGGRTATSNTSIQYTELDPLFQSRRYGPADGSPLVFELPVPDMGPYRVRLYFAELDGLIRGQRIFDVIVEEAVRLEDLDVYRSAGPAKAHIRETYVNVDDGLLTVRLEPQLREAMICGIQVTKGIPTTSRPRLVTVKNR